MIYCPYMILSKKQPTNMFEDKEIKSEFGITIDEMLKNGLHFGHRVSRCHPKMKPYLIGVRSTVHIIDLEKTAESLEKALVFFRDSTAEGKNLMLVGTKVQVKELVKETAEELDLPYVSERWIGGTFTNFEIIKERVNRLEDLEKKKKEGELEKYTKKERLGLEKEVEDLQKKFGGLRKLDKLPDIIFILDMKKDDLAVKEAKIKDIKIVGIVDTNVDPTLADYSILANDDALSSVRYILDKVKEVIKKAK